MSCHVIPSESKSRYNKTLPLWLAKLPDKYFEAFWEGYHTGDGRQSDRREIATSSPDIAGRLYLILKLRGEKISIKYYITTHKDSFVIRRNPKRMARKNEIKYLMVLGMPQPWWIRRCSWMSCPRVSAPSTIRRFPNSST